MTEGEIDTFSLRSKRYVDLQPRDITPRVVAICLLCKRDMLSLRSNVNLSLFIDVRGAKKREPDTLYEHLTLLFNSISPKCRGEVPSGELS